MVCWEGETIVYQFQLPSCPDTTFRLPDTVVAFAFRFTFVPEHFPTCSGSRPYVVGQVPGPLEVRLNRAQPCTFDVAHTYLIPPGAPEARLQAFEQEKRRHAEVLIEAMLQTTHIDPEDLLVVERRFESPEALRDWCTTTEAEAQDSS